MLVASSTTTTAPGSYRVACDLYGFVHSIYPHEIELDLLQNPVATGIDFLLEPAVTSVPKGILNLPDRLELLRNYPNPFNSSTSIPIFSGYDNDVDVGLAVFNILGQNVGEKTVTLNPGINYISWTSGDFDGQLSSGVYFYRIEGLQQTHRMLFLK